MPAAHMSSRLEDTSAVLGEYMLKGWTLTDLHCDTCRVTPLMREPAASASAENRDRIQFCALCDGSPTGRSPPPIPAASSSSQPTGPDPSESISTLLLQGYSLLGENCSNTSCRGIPLVGYPKKKDGSKDGRRMCVACGGRWIDGNDLGGMTLLPASSTSGSAEAQRGGESPRSKARREMYGLAAEGPKGKQPQAAPTTARSVKDSHDDDDDFDLDDMETSEGRVKEIAPASNISGPLLTAPPTAQDATDPVLVAALSKTSASLARTLDRIASSLDRHTESDREEGRYFVDVKLHTEAIKDVVTVMGMVKQYTP